MKNRKVSTSKDLLKFYPFLEQQKEWAKFAEEFNKPECRKNRIKAARALRIPEQPEAIGEILHHCNWVLHGEILSFLPEIGDDGNERFLSPKQVAISRLKAATSLAEKVELLLSYTDAGAELRSGLERAIKRLQYQPDTRSIMDAFNAMCLFIRREERLPSKKELNIEVNRIKKCNVEHIMEDLPSFGQIIMREESVLRNGRPVCAKVSYRVYDFTKGYGIDDEYNECRWIQCRLVPRECWEESYWVDTSEIWKPGGFSGLPKGRKP